MRAKRDASIEKEKLKRKQVREKRKVSKEKLIAKNQALT
jgi:hypothetical protein